MIHFIAALEPDRRGGFGVFFPDLPGLASSGETREDAVARATQALSGHIGAMREDGDEIPAARSMKALSADPDSADAIEGCILVAIPLFDH